MAGADFLCEFKGEKIYNDYYLVKIKNKMLINDEVEIITPKEQFKAVVEGFKTLDGEDVELGNTNDDIYIKFSKTPEDYKYALVRTVGIKNPAAV
ncbi:MAG: U32 family peptidase C-terminal domain-containing protein [Butyrivibrio sp.]|nr:U32 family peptidase C-terminal domain-containing protein [Butyrivibrio sp.]